MQVGSLYLSRDDALLTSAPSSRRGGTGGAAFIADRQWLHRTWREAQFIGGQRLLHGRLLASVRSTWPSIARGASGEA